MMVVFTHFVGSFFPAVMGGADYPIHSKFDLLIHSTPLAVLVNGNFAVCVFFVLSGFVLTRAFFITGDSGLLTRAAIKRYVRLMPPVVASVALAYVILRLGLFYNQQAAQVSGSPGLAEMWPFAAHFREALSQAFYGVFVKGVPGSESYNPVLWTMQIEFLGSFLVFAAAALFGKHHGRLAVYAVLLVLLWNRYYAGFVIGLILADLTTRGGWEPLIAKLKWPVWLGLVLAGLYFGGYPSSASAAGTVYDVFPTLVHALQPFQVWHTLGAGLLVVGVLGWARAQAVLSWRPFVELGRQSFSLYLTHLTLIASFSSYLFLQLTASKLGYRTSFLIMVAVSLVLMFSVSWLYTKWIDEPSIRLAAWVGKLSRNPVNWREQMERVKRLVWHKSDRPMVQFLRYGVVAAVGLVVDFGGLVLFKEVLHWHYILAATGSFIVALVVNYAMSMLWVFPKSRFSRQREFMMFGVIGLLGLGLNDLLMWVLTSRLGLFYVLSKAVATVAVFFWNFFARKAMFAGAKPARPALAREDGLT